MASLLSLGKAKEDMDYRRQAEQLTEYVPDLLRMVFDDDLYERDENDPAVWTPYHALKVLGVPRPGRSRRAADRLFRHRRRVDRRGFVGRLRSHRPGCHSGAPGLLRGDQEHENNARGSASNALVAIVQAHPPARA